MTPMQTLKNQFDLFKNMLPPGVMETALNKSDERVHVANVHVDYPGDEEVYEKKGVRSDFIKFFKAKSRQGGPQSLGFAFTYLDLPQEEHRVLVTLKTGNDDPNYLVSSDLKTAEFQEKFSSAIRKIAKLESKDFMRIVAICKDDFSLTTREDLGRRHQMKRPQ